MKESAVFFDVDGVLIDSLEVKANAFANLFPVEFRDRVRRFHFTNGGMNRVEKIARFSSEITGVELTLDQVLALAEKYAVTVHAEMVSAPEVPGASETLFELHKNYPLHAVSAVPLDELTDILGERGLLGLFVSAHGVPPAKSESLRMLTEKHSYVSDRCLFVGDSIHDFNAAKIAGIPFVHIRAAGQPALSGSAAECADLRGLNFLVTGLIAKR